MLTKPKPSLKQLLKKSLWVPTVIFSILLWVFYSSILLNSLYIKQIQQAKAYSEIIALFISTYSTEQESSYNTIINQQISKILILNPELASIRFYPIDHPNPKTHPEGILAPLALFSQPFVNVSSPILVRLNPQSQPELLGYVITSINSESIVFRWLLLMFQVMFAQILLTLICLLYLSWRASQINRNVGRLYKISQKIINNELRHYVPVAYKRSITKELYVFEDALAHLSNQLILAEDRLKELDAKNQTLTYKDKLVSVRHDSFQSMITHELKTPLNAISGGIQLLKNKHLSQVQSDALTIIEEGSHNLEAILDQIIQLNRIEQGRISVDEKAFNPTQLLQQIAENYQPQAIEKGLDFQLKIHHTQYVLNGDEEKIKQIISELVDNAIKFTKEGEVTIRSQLTHRQTDLEWFVSIIDTGIGIDTDYIKEVFNPFFQIDTGDNRQYEGAGLGLAIVKRLAAMLDVKVSVTTKVEKGCRFDFVLRLHDWQDNKDSQLLAGYTIVHFHTGLSESFCQILEDYSATAVSITAQAELFNYMQQHKVDILTLCDHIDPNTAIDIVKMIREKETTHRTTIYYFKANLSPAKQEQMMAIGIDYFLNPKSSTAEIANIFKSLSG